MNKSARELLLVSALRKIADTCANEPVQKHGCIRGKKRCNFWRECCARQAAQALLDYEEAE